MRVALILSLLLFVTPAVSADMLYTAGHADLGIAFEDGAWDLHVHAEGAIIDGTLVDDEEFEADEVVIVAPASTFVSVVELPVADFHGIPESLGLASDASWFNLFQELSDSDATNSPFLGVAAEEIENDVFVNDEITVSLVDVVGPGEMTVWSNGNGVIFDSLDGFDDDVLSGFPVGTHTHFNYAFSAAGNYEVTLSATGTLVDGGAETTGFGTFTFSVVPEPSALALVALGGVSLAFVRRRFV